MNLSKITIDRVNLSLEEPKTDPEALQALEAKKTRILEAIVGLESSSDWSTLKSLVFDSRIAELEGRLLSESQKNKLDETEIYRLQGRLFEAKKYDLRHLAELYKQELSNIKRLTQPTER